MWGKLRAADGHPAPFNITHVEIGNEQNLTPDLLQHVVDISAAMDARAAQLELDVSFSYYIGHNIDASELAGPALALVQQYLAQTAFLGNRIFWDLHVGAEPDSVPYWESFVC